MFRIGRRLEELNDRVEELRRSSHSQSASDDTPLLLRRTSSLEDIIVELAVRAGAAVDFEQHHTNFLDSGDKAKAEAGCFHETARSAVSASILASLEKTAHEMRFAQSTWRRNLYQRTRAGQDNLFPIEHQPPERDATRAAERSVVRQKHGELGMVFEEMRDVIAESSEREMLSAMRNLSSTRVAPRSVNQPIERELSSWRGPEFEQWARSSFIEKAQLFLQRSIRGIETALAHIGRLPKPLKSASILAAAGLILVAGGCFLFRPGSLFPVRVLNTNYESTATPPSTEPRDEGGEGSNRGVGPAGSTGPWRGGLQTLTAIESKIGTLTAPSQFDWASGRAPDQAAFGPSQKPGPLQLPTVSERAASVSADDIQVLAERGDAKAQYELATNLMNGRDAARNTKDAVRWLEKAGNQGLALAQLRLGIIYGKGFGVDRNFALARKWFQAAAENGNALAMHNLAVLFSEGHGHAPDHAAADVWFRKAAELGIRDSQYNLGIDYMRGVGVEKDLVQSYAWFATAAAQGDAEALKKRKEVRALLDPEELDAAKALANSLIQRQPQAEARE